jgi:hypothetical protein
MGVIFLLGGDVVELHLLPFEREAWALWVKTSVSVFQSGRWRRQRRDLYGGIALES